MDGYWVRTSVKVDLTKEEKVQIGRPSSPRWELDIVGYSDATMFASGGMQELSGFARRRPARL